jgi:hypothetical protein
VTTARGEDKLMAVQLMQGEGLQAGGPGDWRRGERLDIFIGPQDHTIRAIGGGVGGLRKQTLQG